MDDLATVSDHFQGKERIKVIKDWIQTRASEAGCSPGGRSWSGITSPNPKSQKRQLPPALPKAFTGLLLLATATNSLSIGKEDLMQFLKRKQLECLKDSNTTTHCSVDLTVAFSCPMNLPAASPYFMDLAAKTYRWRTRRWMGAPTGKAFPRGKT